MAIYNLSNMHPDVAAQIRQYGRSGTTNQDSLGEWNDPTQYGSYREWYDSLSPVQQWWTQDSAIGRQSNIRNQAINHFRLGGDPATLSIRNFTGQMNPLQAAPASTSAGGGIIQTPQPQPQPQPTGGGYAGGNTGAGNAGMPNPQFTGGPGPQSTGGPMIGTMGGPGYGPNPLGSAGPGGEVWNYYQQNGGLLGGQQQPYQPQQGLFSPNTNVLGGWEAVMHQNFNAMPHIGNPRAPEVTLGGSWLNAGDTMRIPSNLMANVPGLFGGMNQQTQWGGYWGPELTGMVGPHGIAPGYGYYNSNSPVNYTGLFSQSNPFWGNPVASPAFPTPSPQTLSPYHGVGPDSHFGQYFSRMRQNANTTREVRQQQEQARADARRDAEYEMMGCAPGDTACYNQAIRDQG